MIRQTHKNEGGFSVLELMLVVGVVGVLGVIALPQMVKQRRLMRSAAVTREIMTSLRYARQLAMSQHGAAPIGTLKRVAFTFQYDDTTKQIKIIGPIAAGPAALIDANYPNNSGSSVISTISLTQGGLPASEIRYGIPQSADLPSGSPAIPTGALGDGVYQTSLTNSKLNVTFQPDGSVMDSTGNPLDRALFIFNGSAANGTAAAVSVLGTSGRIKIWRYSRGSNSYVE